MGEIYLCDSLHGTHSLKQRLYEASSSPNNIIAQLCIVNEQVLAKGFTLLGFVSFSTLCVFFIFIFFYKVQSACSIGEEVIIIRQL